MVRTPPRCRALPPAALVNHRSSPTNASPSGAPASGTFVGEPEGLCRDPHQGPGVLVADPHVPAGRSDAVRAAVLVQRPGVDAEVLDVDPGQRALEVVRHPGGAVGDGDPDRPAPDRDRRVRLPGPRVEPGDGAVALVGDPQVSGAGGDPGRGRPDRHHVRDLVGVRVDLGHRGIQGVGDPHRPERHHDPGRAWPDRDRRHHARSPGRSATPWRPRSSRPTPRPPRPPPRTGRTPLGLIGTDTFVAPVDARHRAGRRVGHPHAVPATGHRGRPLPDLDRRTDPASSPGPITPTAFSPTTTSASERVSR